VGTKRWSRAGAPTPTQMMTAMRRASTSTALSPRCTATARRPVPRSAPGRDRDGSPAPRARAGRQGHRHDCARGPARSRCHLRRERHPPPRSQERLGLSSGSARRPAVAAGGRARAVDGRHHRPAHPVAGGRRRAVRCRGCDLRQAVRPTRLRDGVGARADVGRAGISASVSSGSCTPSHAMRAAASRTAERIRFPSSPAKSRGVARSPSSRSSRSASAAGTRRAADARRCCGGCWPRSRCSFSVT
jgi:hypothetical protein